MEKPLFNIRSKRNYLRYHYFYGNAYNFVQCFEFALVGIILIFLADALLNDLRILEIPLMLLVIDLVGGALTLIATKFTLNPPWKIWISVTLGNTIFIHCACYGGFFISDLRGLTLLVSIAMYLLAVTQVGRINLYPDRMEIYYGWRRLYTFIYEQVKSVLWASEPIVKRFPAESQTIPIHILTPIELESKCDDLTIYHFYVYVATNMEAVILQPISNRSQFAQNVYNGWIEDFRWGGENVKLKVPPNGFKPKPHPKPYS